jgi:hypothetical protein
MTLYITNQEAETILDLCKGSFLKAQAKFRDSLVDQIETRKGLRGQPNHKQTWVPMRSAWPRNFVKPSRKPRATKPHEPPKQLTAEDILATL